MRVNNSQSVSQSEGYSQSLRLVKNPKYDFIDINYLKVNF